MELPGIIAGVAVRAFALPGDCADCGISPVWFTGSTLAYDLFLPRVRERFNPHAAPADWALAEHRIREASALLGRAGQASGAGDAAALGDLLAVAAAHSPALVRDRVRAAADAFEQAARAPCALEGRARAGRRSSARALGHAPRAGRGGAVVLTLLIAIVKAVEAAAAWHRAQEFRAQARAAAAAAAKTPAPAPAATAPAAAPEPTARRRRRRVRRRPARRLAERPVMSVASRVGG
ncbi:hypothetical protein OG818_23555 [Streptomyces virginiae]|uniref:hypothetical protein n=1 Tax=Streptomyces virginiae TaxID=1961 RepID=UPI002251EA9F|nr:hypothetical protein [Streptomyces virginiae]MCX4718730.1 hypothetical protein [Streptomyces virginiae]